MIGRLRRGALLVLVAGALSACGEREPVRLGYLGGISGRVADLGIAGRNGAQLAVELANQKGGIGGRKIELIVRDDEQNPELASQRFNELATAGVKAVVGPMTSGVAAAILPLVERQKLLTISPTVTATDLAGKDDYFLRVISTAGVYAKLSAQYEYGVNGLRKVAVILDRRNQAYSDSWAGAFRTSFEALGGEVPSYQYFESGDAAGLGTLAEQALRSRPDGVVVVANSVDAALLVQHLRRRSPAVKLVTSEWAATERFVELAGGAAEGVVLAQFFDRSSTAPTYLAFRKLYRERFGEEPGFASITAFDATNVLIEAFAQRPDLPAKDAVMAIRRFAGVQGAVEFDSYGDAVRDVFVTVIRDGKFVVVPRQ